MKRIDAEALVLQLALTIDDVTTEERRALFEMALRVDKARASRAIPNTDVVRPYLVTLTIGMHGLPPADVQRKFQRLVDRHDAAELEHAQWLDAHPAPLDTGTGDVL